MPTSSQALILHNSGVPNDEHVGASCVFSRRASVSSSVYNINGQLPVSKVTIKFSNQFMTLQGREAQPISYTSKMNIDGQKHDVKWNMSSVNPSPSLTSEGLTSDILGSCQGKGAISLASHQSQTKSRPRTAAPTKPAPAKSSISKSHVNPFMYETLVGLGFRKGSLVNNDDCVFDSMAKRKQLYPRRPSNPITKQTHFAVSPDGASDVPIG